MDRTPLTKEQIAERDRKHAEWKKEVRLHALTERYAPGVYNILLATRCFPPNYGNIAKDSYKAAEALAKVIIDNAPGRPE